LQGAAVFLGVANDADGIGKGRNVLPGSGDDGDGRDGGAEETDDALEEGFRAERQPGLRLPHAAASASTQDDAGCAHVLSRIRSVQR
jgi:hypothetical protein